MASAEFALSPTGGEGWGEGAISSANSAREGKKYGRSTDLIVLLPVKDLARAKLRLARALGPDQRRSLALAMLEDVVAAVRAAGLVATVLTPDDEVAAFAGKRGALVLRQSPTARSLNAALTQAIQDGTGPILVLLPDIPLVTPSEIQSLLSACSTSRPGIVLAPDRAGTGTNGLALSHPGGVPMCFGRGSHERFLRAAEAYAVEVCISHEPGIALDIDTPADLRELLARPAGTATHRLLGQIATARLLATDARTT